MSLNKIMILSIFLMFLFSVTALNQKELINTNPILINNGAEITFNETLNLNLNKLNASEMQFSCDNSKTWQQSTIIDQNEPPWVQLGYKSLYVGDIDGDSKTEIVISRGKYTYPTSQGELNIYEYDGSNYVKEHSLPTEREIYAVTYGDIDNDGLGELVGIGYPGKVYIYDFNGTSWSEQTLSLGTGSHPMEHLTGVAIGDADNDGANEMIIIENDCTNRIAKIDWTGSSWTVGKYYFRNCGANSVAISPIDFDLNGRKEIMIASTGYDNGFQVAEWTGSGFTRQNVNSMNMHSISVKDVDNDGELEVLGVNHNNHSAIIYDYNGTGWVRTIIDMQLEAPGELLSDDFDGDGDNDLMEVSYAGNPGQDSKVSIRNWSGSGWNSPIYITTPHQTNQVEFADADNDGVKELVFASYSLKNISIYENTPKYFSKWEKYNPFKVFSLKNNANLKCNSNPGLKTVYVNFKNNDGKITSSQDSIRLLNRIEPKPIKSVKQISK